MGRMAGDPHKEREMEDMCEGMAEEQSTFADLNDTLQSISGDLAQITDRIAGHLDRLVGVATECPAAEKPLIEPSQPGLVGALDDKVRMLQRRVTELHEQLNRVDGKF